MVRRCMVPTCKHTTTVRFPHPEWHRDRFDKWLDAIGEESYLEKDRMIIYNNYRLCKNHFSEDQILFHGKLKSTSVPNINLPDVVRKSFVDKPVDLPSSSCVGTSTLLSADVILDDFKPFSYGDSLIEEKILGTNQDLIRKKAPEESFDMEILEERLFVDNDGLWQVSAEEFILPSTVSGENIVKDTSVQPCVIFITPDCIEQFKNGELELDQDELEQQASHINPSDDCFIDNDDHFTDTYIRPKEPSNLYMDFDFKFRQDCRRKYGKKGMTMTSCSDVEVQIVNAENRVSPVELVDMNLLSTPEIIIDTEDENSQPSTLTTENTDPDKAGSTHALLPSSFFGLNHICPSVDPKSPIDPSPVSKARLNKRNKTKKSRKNIPVVMPQAIRCDFCNVFVRTALYIAHTSAHYMEQQSHKTTKPKLSFRPYTKHSSH